MSYRSDLASKVFWHYQKHLDAFFLLLSSFPPRYQAHLYNPNASLVSYLKKNPKDHDEFQAMYKLYLQDRYAQDLQWIALESSSHQDLIHRIQQCSHLNARLKDMVLLWYTKCFCDLLQSFTPQMTLKIDDLLKQFLPDLMQCRQALFKQSSDLHLIHVPSLTQYARVYTPSHSKHPYIICSLAMSEAHCFCQILHESTHLLTDQLFFRRHPHLKPTFQQNTRDFLHSSTHHTLEKIAVRHASRIIQHVCPHRMIQDQQWKSLYKVEDL